MQAIQKLADKASIDSILSFRTVPEWQAENNDSNELNSICGTEGLQSQQLEAFAAGGSAATRAPDMTI